MSGKQVKLSWAAHFTCASRAEWKKQSSDTEFLYY